MCVHSCVRLCVNNIFLFTHSPLLFTINHLHYGGEKKVDVSIQCLTHFLNTISLHYGKRKKEEKKRLLFHVYGTKHFDLHEAVLMQCTLEFW